MPDVTCLGILVADVWGKPVNDWPQRGRLSLVNEIGMGIGGCAANTGIDLLKLGCDVAIMGKVGSDGFGDFVRDVLSSAGADSTHVLRDPEVGTSATMIMVDDAGERTFIHYIGANARVRLAELDMSVIAASKIFHFAGALVMPGFDGEQAAEAFRLAKQAGVTTSLDTVWNDTVDWLALMSPLFPHTDLFLPGLSEAQRITGLQAPADVAQALLDMGVGTVGLKMGEEGSYVRTCDAELHVPAFKVQAMDGTGAGDAYVAGFIRGVLEGWDLERTSRFASAVGALCVTAMGTTAGVRDMRSTLEFLAEHDGPQWLEPA